MGQTIWLDMSCTLIEALGAVMGTLAVAAS